MPNDKIGQIKSETDKLNAQIQEDRAKFEKVILQLRHDKGSFEEMQREKYLKNKQELEQILNEIQQLESFNQEVVKDHVDSLSTHELEERRQQEELEQIRQENAAMREQIRQATMAATKTKTKAKTGYINDTVAYQDKFREQGRI